VDLTGGKAQAHERFGDAALFALLEHQQQHPRAAAHVALAGWRGGGGGALAFPVEETGAEGQVDQFAVQSRTTSS
jgi:hypothetical protein